MNKNEVRVDFDRLGIELKKRNSTQTEASIRIGKEKSWIAHQKKSGVMSETMLSLICDLYGIKKEDVMVQSYPTYAPITQHNKGDILEKLDIIIDLLTEKKKKDAILSAQEDAVLLLEQMLKHGQCKESQFKAKMKSLGYGYDICNYAEDYLHCQREVLNGDVWLKAKK